MANGSRHSMYYIVEATYGTTPNTPSMTKLRHTATTLGLQKDTLSSNELRSDRNVTDFRMGQNKIGGKIDLEVINSADFEDLLEACLCGTWSTNVLKNGTTRRSFSLLKYYEDLGAGNTPYHLFTGLEVASVNVKIPTNGIATASFDFIGQGLALSESAPSGATLGSASVTQPMDSFTGTVEEGGASIAVITSMNFTIDNGLDRRFVLGSRNTIRPDMGKCMVSGELECFFESKTLLDKFINDTNSSIKVTLVEGTSTLMFEFNEVKYTGGYPEVPDDKALILKMPFQAVYDAVDTATIKVTRSA